MNDCPSNYSPSAASTFGPWCPSSVKNRMIRPQHTQTLTLEPITRTNHKRIQSRSAAPQRRAVSVQRRLPTAPTMEIPKPKIRTLPEPIMMNLTQQPLYQRSTKVVQDILKKLQYYRVNELHLIS